VSFFSNIICKDHAASVLFFFYFYRPKKIGRRDLTAPIEVRRKTRVSSAQLFFFGQTRPSRTSRRNAGVFFFFFFFCCTKRNTNGFGEVSSMGGRKKKFEMELCAHERLSKSADEFSQDQLDGQREATDRKRELFERARAAKEDPFLLYRPDEAAQRVYAEPQRGPNAFVEPVNVDDLFFMDMDPHDPGHGFVNCYPEELFG
jgi:hypothetical protein